MVMGGGGVQVFIVEPYAYSVEQPVAHLSIRSTTSILVYTPSS